MQVIFLLGRRDSPTDALEDYSTCLGQALAKKGCQSRLVRVSWAEVGWPQALRWLWNVSVQWKGNWVLVQYTALQWSRRGLPLGLIPLIGILQMQTVRVGVVFHDVIGYSGTRLHDRIRKAVQRFVMRTAVRLADRIITTVEPARLPWLGRWALHSKVAFLPVGSNLPERWRDTGQEKRRDGCPTIAVFGITGGERRKQETAAIGYVLRETAKAVGPVRLVAFGRGSAEAEPSLQEQFNGTPVAVEVLGLLPASQASEVLASADLQLFVRGGISSRRGSAIAGIACGLPIVAYRNQETGFPITEAGVRLVELGNVDGLAGEVIQVLTNDRLRDDLRHRSREAARRYFSWEAIAQRFLEALSP